MPYCVPAAANSGWYCATAAETLAVGSDPMIRRMLVGWPTSSTRTAAPVCGASIILPLPT